MYSRVKLVTDRLIGNNLCYNNIIIIVMTMYVRLCGTDCVICKVLFSVTKFMQS